MLLGAAPGVEKTFAMLPDEGYRLQQEGNDAVVGVVNTHDRGEVAVLLEGLEKVQPLKSTGPADANGAMDVNAVLTRSPGVALVDELARVNDERSRYATRWGEVTALLNAGIDVLTTLNVQNLLNDVVYQITGIKETETIVDDLVRQGAEVELVDLTQEGIQERLVAGKIYPAEDIDAALANYFRPGNLSALRELALSWTADRVEETLTDYRLTHGIEQTWETKERIIVALPASDGADAVVRRAARTALRSRAELLGVFVRPPNGPGDREAQHLAEQRALLESLGGSYHEVVGENVAEALLAFTKAENATQIVLGTPRNPRFGRWLGPSVVGGILKRSGTIEVHVVSYESSPPSKPESSPRRSSALNKRRRVAAWLVAAISLPILTTLLLSLRGDIVLENVLVVYLLAAVAVGMIGGALPAVASGAGGFLHDVWGPNYGEETNYLRVFMAQIGRKLEPNPNSPRHFITEPGMGYRLEL